MNTGKTYGLSEDVCYFANLLNLVSKIQLKFFIKIRMF